MTTKATENRVALVQMPWASTRRPSIALGILKECAKSAGFTADVYYFNLNFARRIGFDLFERISLGNSFYPEWFFATGLFGRNGLDLIANSWSELHQSEKGRAAAARIQEITDDDPELSKVLCDEATGFIDDCFSKIDWNVYKVVGFSSTFAQSIASLALAQRIKAAHPSVVTVFGGANFEGEMGFEQLKAFDWVDYVVHGEGEESFPKLLQHIAEGKEERVAGVSMRLHGQSVSGFHDARPIPNMDASPIPDYEDYFRQLSATGLDQAVWISMPIESSRGCWWGEKHHCTFCGLNGQTMSFRRKSPERTYSDIMTLAKRYRQLHFTAVDNILSMGYFRELLPMLAAADVDVTLFYEVKANLNREHVKALAEAGIKRIQPGIESLNSDLLRRMRKGVTAIQNIQFLKWCTEFNIEVTWNLLYRFPGESPANYAQYPSIMAQLVHLRPPAGVFPIVFERYSPYHFEPETFKLQIRALPDYEFIYPESLVNPEKVAYYFTGEWQDQLSNEDYIEPVKAVFDEWIEHWKGAAPLLCYEKGPGFLVIYDSRPGLSQTHGRMRRRTLSELQTRVYLFCDENRSFSAIYEMLSREFPGRLTQAEARTLLDQFVSAHLMYREDDRYLSLAVRGSIPSEAPEAAANPNIKQKGLAPMAESPVQNKSQTQTQKVNALISV